MYPGEAELMKFVCFFSNFFVWVGFLQSDEDWNLKKFLRIRILIQYWIIAISRSPPPPKGVYKVFCPLLGLNIMFWKIPTFCLKKKKKVLVIITQRIQKLLRRGGRGQAATSFDSKDFTNQPEKAPNLAINNHIQVELFSQSITSSSLKSGML